MYRSLEAKTVAEPVSVYDTALSVLCNIAVYLLLSLLAWEFKVGPEEMLGINPCARNAVDSYIIQKQQVWSDDGSAFAVLLLGE